MDFIRRHKRPATILSVIFIGLPQYIDSVWSLAEKITGRNIAMPNITWAYWITVPISIIMIGAVVWSIKKTNAKLTITGAEIYEVGDGSHWLRLKVENPNLVNVEGCYGKLLERKMVGELSEVASLFDRQRGVAKSGSVSLENWQLPPEGHRFPWSLTDHSLTTINISGNGGCEYLYLVVKRKQVNCLCFPNSMGNEYKNWRLTDFEMKLEIGSDDAEAIKLTRVHTVFRATVDNIELVKWSVID